MSTSNREIFAGSSCTSTRSCGWVSIRWWNSDECSSSMSQYGHGLLPKAGLEIAKSSANMDLVPLCLCLRSHARFSSNLWLLPHWQPSCCSGRIMSLIPVHDNDGLYFSCVKFTGLLQIPSCEVCCQVSHPRTGTPGQVRNPCHQCSENVNWRHLQTLYF